MSRRKIKKGKRKQKVREHIADPREALALLRDEKRSSEAKLVEDLIIKDKLDLDRLDDYQYMAQAAKDVGWSMGRLNKAIERAGVREVLKEQEE